MKKKIAAVILIVVLAVGLGAGYWYYNNSKENEKPTTTTQAANGEPVTVPAEYNEYYQKNNDFVGWIKIDETPVDYPVVQTDDN